MLNRVTKLRRPPLRTSWWTTALLGALLVIPAELADAAPREREQERAASAKSSGSKATGSSAKASSSSRSSSRSQPRAKSNTSSRSQPRARSGSSSRSQPRAKSGSSSRSQPRVQNRSQTPRRQAATSRSRQTTRSRETYERPSRQTRERKSPRRRAREIREQRPSGNSTSKMENVTPVGRTEISPPGDATATSERRRPHRTDVTPRSPLTRPRYRTPSERSPNNRSPNEGLNGVELRRPADERDRNRHYEVEVDEPASPSTTTLRGNRPRQRRHDRGHGTYGGHHRHRHRYGCGHYGYGYSSRHYDYGYDPYYAAFGFGYYSPYFSWGLGSWGPETHVYGVGSGGGGSTRHYREAGLGALDLDLRPETTEIYVDGTYVGVADQFDGFPRYLWLDEGTYEIAFYKEGYETIFRQYTIYPGVTIEARDRMRPGQAVPVAPAAGAYPVAGAPSSGYPTAAEPPPPAGIADSDGGRVAIIATPGDAAVYLDGHFVGTAAEIAELSAGLIVEPGDHMVDIIRPGYDNQQVPISVASGERIDLKLDLRRP